MKTLLKKQFPPSDEEVVNVLGHSVNALYSVPTAIYCFLRNSEAKDNQENLFRATLEYTISLGGDTDTVSLRNQLPCAYLSLIQFSSNTDRFDGLCAKRSLLQR